MSNGWSDFLYNTEVRIVVTVVDFSSGGISYPVYLRNIWNYLESFFRMDPSGLQSSEGISAINVKGVAHNTSMDSYDQQVFTATINVEMIYAKATTLD
jgi:hypothetical protein